MRRPQSRREARRKLALRELDADRMAMFGELQPGEQPVEHAAAWAQVGWPIFPTSPDRVALGDGVLDDLVPPWMLDEMGGIPLPLELISVLVLTLVTDRRLLVLPLDPQSPAPVGSRYAVYDAQALRTREIPLRALSRVRLIGTGPREEFPVGGRLAMYVKILGSGPGEVVGGPPYPSFDIEHFEQSHDVVGPEPGLVLAFGDDWLDGAGDFLVGLMHVGIAPDEEVDAEFIAARSKARRGRWLPVYQR